MTPSSSYTAKYSLHGHFGRVLCLSTSEDGRLLATGGIDGTKIWCLQAMQLLHEIPSFKIRGATTEVCWIRRDDNPEVELLAYGTQCGFVIFLRRSQTTVFTEFHVAQIHDPSEITGIAYSSSSNRVAMVNVKGSVVTMSIDPVTMQPSLHGGWCVVVADCMPGGVAFNTERDIMVFGTYDGIHVLHNSNGALMKTQNLATTIGKVSSDPVKNLFCTDTMTEGLTLHRMSDAAQVGSFPIPKDRIKIAAPIGVTFGEGCKIVVAGSDHGLLYIFDLRTGSLLERLTVTEGAWIQAVTTTHVNGIPAVIAGCSATDDHPSDVIVFLKDTTPSGSSPIVRQFSFRKVLDTLAIAVVAAAALTAVYQNWGFFQQGWKQDGNMVAA
ncbi:WD40 repeat-like protein [Hymenopellis radicata]|nr:WD40 repeat-like protein [Hymenopellis radicata]